MKKFRGQCFLCTRDVVMILVGVLNRTMYKCPCCGGHNSVERVEARMDVNGKACEDFGPVEEPAAEEG